LTSLRMNPLLKGALPVVVLLFYSNVMAQPKQPARKDLLQAMVDQKVSVVDIKEVTMAEGQAAPRHLHPCPVVGYVVSGSILFQVEGEAARILKAGDAFYEPRNKTILHFDNASKEKPLTFVAFYLKEAGEETIKLLKD
jgi:quercetin dioxygenase-like cupin family protein